MFWQIELCKSIKIKQSDQHLIDNKNRLNLIGYSWFHDRTIHNFFKPVLPDWFFQPLLYFWPTFFSITLKPMPKIGEMSPF